MLRLSVPIRQALSRLTLPVMIVVSFAVLLIGRADQGFSAQLSGTLDDLLAPVYAAAAAPVNEMIHGTGAIAQIFSLEAENEKLRAENDRLREWQSVAMALAAQDASLKATLHYIPPEAPFFFTGDVVADVGGPYARSILVSLNGAPSTPSGLLGAVALDGSGVAGRVVEAGTRSVRVLLITDLNSRVPVLLGTSGTPALMAGTNGPEPSLLYWTPGNPPAEGTEVLTSAAGGAYPAGLPVGVVHYNTRNDPVVLPLADLSALRLLRLYKYSDDGPVLTPVVKTPVSQRSKPIFAAAPVNADHGQHGGH